MALLSSDPETDLLTKAEAAKLLKVSPVTISRWLKQGRLPAYRLGPRAIRIRRADLNDLLDPVVGAEEFRNRMPTPTRDQPQATIYHDIEAALKLLTDEEIERGLAAMDAAQEHLRQMLAERGGQPVPSSWRLIREERMKR